MSKDISEALSTAIDVASSQANKTLDGIFGAGVFVTKKLIMDFMYKGQMPIPNLQRNIKLEEEEKFLDDALYKLKNSIAVVLGFSLLINLILICIICLVPRMKQSLQDVNDLDRRNRRRQRKRDRRELLGVRRRR